MRRIAVVGMIISGLVALPLIAGAAAGGTNKVQVCHFPDGGGDPHEIVIAEKALKGHANHGDIVGACLERDSLPPVNTPPVAVIAPIDCGAFSCDMVLDGTDSFDDEGDPLTFAWTVVGTSNTYSSSEAFWYINAPPADTYEVTLVVSDGELSDTSQTTVVAP
ncbi:MAG: hypothetical protein P1T08_06780 [Acidimicrobiia bacterium]|nr:hypothetical protein [Acidimicrobiia bacterium]